MPAIAIPVALIGTFALVLASDFSLNQLTLFGLVPATGLVVDDAITVVEDTSAKKDEGMTSVQAAMETMDELFAAVIATFHVKVADFCLCCSSRELQAPSISSLRARSCFQSESRRLMR